MLRPILTRLLILFLLSSNLGWAVDQHVEAIHESETEASALAQDHEDDCPSSHASDHEDSCPSGINCHHACHASAHLLSLPSNMFTLRFDDQGTFITSDASSIVSFISSPPFHPPRN